MVIDGYGLIISLNVLFLGFNSIAQKVLQDANFNYVTTSGCSLIFGTITGILILGAGNREIFNVKVFSYLMLPMIRFGNGLGYNKTQFAKSIGLGIMFGLLGTLVYQQTLYYSLVYLDTVIVFFESEPNLKYPTIQALSIILCSRDYVTSLRIMTMQGHHDLYSLSLSEGLFNDITVFGMFQVFMQNQTEFNSLFQLILKTLIELSASVLFGLLIGSLMVLMFKYVRHLSHNNMTMGSLFFYFGYFSFALPDSFKYSGLIAGTVSGMINGIFAPFNIKPECYQQVSFFVNTLSLIFGQIIFFYIGTVFWNYIPITNSTQVESVQWQLIGISLAVIVISRTIYMTITYLIYNRLMRLFKLDGFELSVGDLATLIITGFIRGTVAFVLVKQIVPQDTSLNEYVKTVQAVVIIIVLMTNIFLGGFLDLITQYLASKKEQKQSNMIDGVQLEEGSISDRIILLLCKIFIYRYEHRPDEIQKIDGQRRKKENNLNKDMNQNQQQIEYKMSDSEQTEPINSDNLKDQLIRRSTKVIKLMS